LSIYHIYVNKNPTIRDKLKKAHIKERPEVFVKKAMKGAATLSVFVTLIFFFGLDMTGKPKLHLLWLFPVTAFMVFSFFMRSPEVKIRKRQREIDKDVLFAGRFILVKIEAGEPFFNALQDASKAKGVAGKYFKEIIDDINLGTPIERAIENAIEASPSDKFRRVLWQINNSLRTGTDVANTLRAILKQITDEQVIEIKEYGKKLNSLAMFYMLLGIVVPALGMTLFIILASFIGLSITPVYLVFAAIMLAFTQFMFISIFKAIRPMVNL